MAVVFKIKEIETDDTTSLEVYPSESVENTVFIAIIEEDRDTYAAIRIGKKSTLELIKHLQQLASKMN